MKPVRMRDFSTNGKSHRSGLGAARKHRHDGSGAKLTSSSVFNSLAVHYLLSQPRSMTDGLIDQDGKRDLDTECHYPQQLNIKVYRELFSRVAIANKAVRIFPDECSAVRPEIFQREKFPVTPWEKKLKQFEVKQDFFGNLHRWDVATRLGRWGGLLIGLNDGRAMKRPVAGISEAGLKIPRRGLAKPRDILYLRPLAEDHLEVVRTEKDPNSPRYKQPTMYRLVTDSKTHAGGVTSPSDIMFDDDFDEEYDVTEGGPLVHWHRVVHSAENIESCPWRAMPILQPIANVIWDCRKVLGSSAEMFYKSAFFGISFETHPGLSEFVDVDMDELKDEIDAYQHGLQRFLRLVNMSAKPLASQVSSPKEHMLELYRLISAVIGVPLPILLGADQGKSDAGLNSATWNRKLTLRNQNYLEPRMIRPAIDRFMLMDALPLVDEYFCEWRDLNTQTEKDRADVALKLTQALLQYVTSGAMNLVPPRQYFVQFLKMTDEVAEEMIRSAGGEGKIKKMLKELVKKDAGNTPGTKPGDPSRRTGAGGSRNGQARRRKTAVKRSS